MKTSSQTSKNALNTFFYKKPSSSPSTKSVFILGHVLVLKESLKFLNLANSTAVKSYAERDCSKLFCPTTNKMCQYVLNSKVMSYSQCFDTALR